MMFLRRVAALVYGGRYGGIYPPVGWVAENKNWTSFCPIFGWSEGGRSPPLKLLFDFDFVVDFVFT
jgi:hypothetical protein